MKNEKQIISHEVQLHVIGLVEDQCGISISPPGGRSQGRTSFWTFTRFGRKVAWSKSTSLFHDLILKELVFLHCKYYSIFLLQQEASAK
jgi:hypothetical protein